MKKLIVGSSLHQRTGRWQIWAYDESRDEIAALAGYKDKEKCDAAAFDLTYSLPKGDEECLKELTEAADFEPVAFSLPEDLMLKAKIKQAITNSEPGSPGKAAVSTFSTDFDRVNVIRWD